MNIIHAAYEKYGRPVVILIDEYDNPVISTMHDMERSEANRLLLKSTTSTSRTSTGISASRC